MATFRGYKCTKCGYVVMADASVYEAFMFVTNYYFFCSHCNDIVRCHCKNNIQFAQNVGEWMGFAHGIL